MDRHGAINDFACFETESCPETTSGTALERIRNILEIKAILIG